MATDTPGLEFAARFAAVTFSIPSGHPFDQSMPENNFAAGTIFREALALELQRAGINADEVAGGGPLNESVFTILSPSPKTAAAAALDLLRRLGWEGLASVWYFQEDECAMFCLSQSVSQAGRPYDFIGVEQQCKRNLQRALRNQADTAAALAALARTPQPPQP